MVSVLLVSLWLSMVTLGRGSGKDMACDGPAHLLCREEKCLQWVLSIYSVSGWLCVKYFSKMHEHSVSSGGCCTMLCVEKTSVV